MKKIVMILLVLIVAAGSAFAFNPDELNRITFINDTGYDIYYIFLSPGDSDYWGPEILGANWVLGADESLGFYIHYPDYTNNFDIMAIDDDGYTFIIWDYPVSDDGPAEITFEFDDLLDDPPDMEFVTLNIANETDYDQYLLFVSPEDSRMWGVDMLDENTILGTNENFPMLVPVFDDTTTYNILSVDEDMDEYQFDVHINTRYADEDGNIWISIEPDDLM